MGGREEDPSSLAAPTQAFPWLVKVVVISPRLELLCGGVVLSDSIVLVPAHCVSGIPSRTVRVLVARQTKIDGSDSISDVAYHVSCLSSSLDSNDIEHLGCAAVRWLNKNHLFVSTS